MLTQKRLIFLIYIYKNTFFSTFLLPILQNSSLFYGNRNIESNNNTPSNAAFPYTWTLIYPLTAS